MDRALATIIVVSFNSRQWLARQRAALEAQTDTRWRLVMLDNASDLNQRPRLHELPATALLIQSDANLGFAAGNNRAAREVTTPYLILLNPDAFPEPNWLAALLQTAESHPTAAAIGSTQYRADIEGVLDGSGDVMLAGGVAYRSNFGRRRAPPAQLGETFAACAAAMLIRNDAFKSANGFDERYFCFAEDVDLCFRLRLLGYKVLQSPSAVVHHVGGGSTGSRSGFARYHGARNTIWTFIKCMPAPLFWLMLPLHVLLMTTMCIVSLFRSDGLATLRGVAAGLAECRIVWRNRQEIQRTRRIPWTQIASKLMWNPFSLLTRTPRIFIK